MGHARFVHMVGVKTLLIAIVIIAASATVGTSIAQAGGSGATVIHSNCTFGGFTLPDGTISGLVIDVDGIFVENKNGADFTCSGTVDLHTDDLAVTLVAQDSDRPLRGNAIAANPAGVPCHMPDGTTTFDYTIHYSAGGTAMIKCHR